MALISVTFKNGKTIKLTPGEIDAIERYARTNGTDPEQPQYHPGVVRYTTTANLVRKGVMRMEHGVPHFLEGLLEVRGGSLLDKEPFILDR